VIGDPGVIEPLDARVAYVERHLHAPEEFDEVIELGVAGRVAAAADCGPRSPFIIWRSASVSSATVLRSLKPS